MTDDREPLARVALEALYAWAAEQPFGEAPWLHDWVDMSPPKQEALMRVGSAVAARAVVDAKLHDDRARALLFALGANRGAIIDSLRSSIAEAKYEADKRRYRNALTALGGDEEGTTP